MKFIDSLDENSDKKETIIRAHGITKETYEKAQNEGIKLIDLTCPKVLKIHRIVEEFYQKGYFIFLIGAKKHPEIIGTASFGEKNVCIIEQKEDIDNAIKIVENANFDNIAVVVQTTFSMSKFEEFVNYINSKITNKNVEIVNTICNATKVRQEETEEISKLVDCMIIIGGKNSSNTKKLYEIAINNCNSTVCIESYDEIDLNNYTNSKKIGIMAGASTPQESIEEVIKKLSKL